MNFLFFFLAFVKAKVTNFMSDIKELAATLTSREFWEQPVVNPFQTIAIMLTISIPSFDTDDLINPIFSIAFPLFIAFFPIIGVVGGLTLGFGLVNKVTALIKSMV